MTTNQMFNEIIDIMEDVSGKMPEGNYITLYNKIRDLKKLCDSQYSKEKLMDYFNDGYEEAESDLAYERGNAIHHYKVKCARLIVENSEYKNEISLEREKQQNTNQEYEERINALNLKQTTLKKEIDNLKNNNQEYEERINTLNLKQTSLKKENDSLKITIEQSKNENTFKLRQCKCGSKTHFRTNHKSCILNKAFTTIIQN